MNTGIMVLPNVLELLVRLGRKRFIEWPTAIEAEKQIVPVDADSSRPLGYRKRFSVVGNVTGRALVVVLLFLCFPSAVFGEIPERIVNSSYGRPLKWPRPHVLVEGKERLQPAITNGDTSPAVVFVVGVPWIVAALLHAAPNAILRRCSTLSILAFSPASARLDALTVPSTEVATGNQGGIATFAVAEPMSGFVACGGTTNILQNRQFSEDVPLFVFDVGIQWSRIALSHLNFLSKFVMVKSRPGATYSSSARFIVPNTKTLSILKGAQS